jgi:2-iminobutanoate/2-iminopropanoate deaminase
MKVPMLIVGILFFFSCIATGAAQRKYVKPTGSAKDLPFSEAVQVGDALYVAGHIGLDPKTGQAPASAEEEARNVMEDVKATVEQAGFSMDDLISVQIFCTDLSLYDTFNNVYKTYFHGNYPARAFIGAAKLVRDGRFEVLGVAVKRGAARIRPAGISSKP